MQYLKIGGQTCFCYDTPTLAYQLSRAILRMSVQIVREEERTLTVILYRIANFDECQVVIDVFPTTVNNPCCLFVNEMFVFLQLQVV